MGNKTKVLIVGSNQYLSDELIKEALKVLEEMKKNGKVKEIEMDPNIKEKL